MAKKRLDIPEQLAVELDTLHQYLKAILDNDQLAYKRAVDYINPLNSVRWYPSRSKLATIYLEKRIEQIKEEITL